jgi:DNA-directed RNA polymerase subunit beta'
MHLPTQEAITGVYLLTQTPQGRAKINAIMPDKKYHIRAPMTARSMSTLLKRMSLENPGHFPRVVNALKDFGNKYSYQLGFTLGLEDLEFDKKIRDKIFKEAEAKVKKAKDKPAAIISAYTDAAEKLDKALLDNKRLQANGFMIMANSGAKGNIAQIRQILAAPVLVRDVHNNLVPVPIKRGYAEGLDLADYWASMSGARKGMIDRSLQTQEPGALAKELMNTTVGEIISELDCGTTKGIDLSVDSEDVLDRYLATFTKGVGARNTLTTYIIVSNAKKKGIKTLKVRSPLTCESSRGTCKKCFGLDENGKLPSLGTNIGVIAGQAISERATQLTMRTFHTGGAAEGGGVTAGFDRVKELLEIPKVLRGKATLAQESGKIGEIKESPLGGWDIFIGKNKHRVPKPRKILVKEGDKVQKGQILSDGVQHPHEILRLRGMRAAQEYLTDQLQEEYKSQNAFVKRKIIESIVKPLTNTVRILDPGSHEDYVPGDHVPYNMVEKWNEDQKDTNKRIIAEPMLRGINTAPLMSEDWIQRLNFQRLKDTLLEGPSQAWGSPISSPFSPLSAFAYGAEIGKEKLE